MRVAILGIGRLGKHLSSALQKAGHNVVEIRTHDAIQAAKNAENCDLLLICVQDKNIDKLNNTLRCNIPIAHVSGNTDMDSISNISSFYGVFYCLQTFSSEDNIDFLSIPICIEGSSSQTENILYKLASSISNNVYKIDSEQRKLIHLSAVFACNYSNLMYCIAEHILKQGNMNLDLLYPIIEQTATKIRKMSPYMAQTGPASREDTATMKEHLLLLKTIPNGEDLSTIYSSLSNIIKNNKEL